MPIYEYECGACGHQLEAFQKISDNPLIDCPACHQATLNKLVSSTSFQLKGTGWYATDFKDKGKPKTTAAESVTDSKDATQSTPSTPQDKAAE